QAERKQVRGNAIHVERGWRRSDRRKLPWQAYSQDGPEKYWRLVQVLHRPAIKSDAPLTRVEPGQPSHFESYRHRPGPVPFQRLGRLQTAQQRCGCEVLQSPSFRAIEANVVVIIQAGCAGVSAASAILTHCIGNKR